MKKIPKLQNSGQPLNWQTSPVLHQKPSKPDVLDIVRIALMRRIRKYYSHLIKCPPWWRKSPKLQNSGHEYMCVCVMSAGAEVNFSARTRDIHVTKISSGGTFSTTKNNLKMVFDLRWWGAYRLWMESLSEGDRSGGCGAIPANDVPSKRQLLHYCNR